MAASLRKGSRHPNFLIHAAEDTNRNVIMTSNPDTSVANPPGADGSMGCRSVYTNQNDPRFPISRGDSIQPMIQPMAHDEHNRILIVDDHGDTGRALSRLLRRRGYEAEYVTSGREAVDVIRRGILPQLVILDVMMPDMSGIQTLVEMKRTGDFDETPVVMYSASEDPGTMQQAFLLGAKDYILKGSDWDEMIRRIDTAFPA